MISVFFCIFQHEMSSLFIRENGEPCIFSYDGLDNETVSKIKKIIKKCGGILLKLTNTHKTNRLNISMDHHIILVHPDSIIQKKYEVDVFSYKYIEECYNAHKIQNNPDNNLKQYLVGKSKFEKYNPLEIMFGSLKWGDLLTRCEVLLERLHQDDDNQENPNAENSIIMKQFWLQFHGQPENSKENNVPNIIEEEVSDIEDDDVLKQPSVRNQKNRQKKKSTSTTTTSGSDFRSRVQPSKVIQVSAKECTKELQAKNKVSAWLASNKRNKNQIDANETLGTNFSNLQTNG